MILHPVSKPAPYEVTLSNGSTIESTTLAISGVTLSLHDAAGQLDVPLKDVQQIVGR